MLSVLLEPLWLMRSLALRLYRAAVVLGGRAAANGFLSMGAANKLEVHGSAAETLTHGIDCTCYFSENFYVTSPVERHFTFEGAPKFREEHVELLESLGDVGAAELLERLETEAARRRNAVRRAAERKADIALSYQRLHPELWQLCERWLDPELLALSRARSGDGSGPAALRQVADGVYTLRVFSREFCQLLCEELEAFAQAGLPAGKPNSMNNAGVLLDELGFGPQFLDVLLREYLNPLAASLAPLVAEGGGSLDHHKSFVVRYRIGEDEQLAAHYDNSEVDCSERAPSGKICFWGMERGRMVIGRGGMARGGMARGGMARGGMVIG